MDGGFGASGSGLMEKDLDHWKTLLAVHCIDQKVSLYKGKIPSRAT